MWWDCPRRSLLTVELAKCVTTAAITRYLKGERMNPDREHLLVLNTCPGSITAKKIAQNLVEAGHAACVNILAAHSIFWWKGRVEASDEHVLLIKTRLDLYPEVERAILAQHPYELPEIIAVPIKAGLAGYLSWIDEVTSTSR